tara:strand:- start:190 stop:459 length:270 start_codon:yes stop_codon:yes gene_type:complete
MNKKLIAKIISSELNLNLNLSKKIINAFINIIKEESKEKKIKIGRFGTFYKHKTPKRIGRNPKTKESYIIAPMKKITFKSSHKVRKLMN